MQRSMKALAMIFVAALLPMTVGLAKQTLSQNTKAGDVNRKVSTQAATPNGSLPAQMEFQYTAGRGGGFDLKMSLADVTSVKGFNFDDFEGPDAPSGNHKLGQIRVQSAAGSATFDATVGGWYATNTEFVFSVSLKAMPLRLKPQFARALSGSDAKLTFTLHGFKKPSAIISSTSTDAPCLSAFSEQFKHR